MQRQNSCNDLKLTFDLGHNLEKGGYCVYAAASATQYYNVVFNTMCTSDTTRFNLKDLGKLIHK